MVEVVQMSLKEADRYAVISQKALVIYNIVYNLVDEQQRIQALADSTRRELWNSKGLAPQGVLERQTIHHPDAKH